jgi:hypothetical protein
VKKRGLFVDSVIYYFMLFWTSFELAGNSNGAEAARKYAITAYRIDSVEDQTFMRFIGLQDGSASLKPQGLIWNDIRPKRGILLGKDVIHSSWS